MQKKLTPLLCPNIAASLHEQFLGRLVTLKVKGREEEHSRCLFCVAASILKIDPSGLLQLEHAGILRLTFDAEPCRRNP